MVCDSDTNLSLLNSLNIPLVNKIFNQTM